MSKYSRKFKRALALVLTFVMAVSVITVTPSTNVEAASNKVVKSLAGVPAAKTMNVGETTSFKANVKTTKKVAKNLLQVTVKSSDSSVVAAKVAAKPKNKKKAKKGASVINLTAGKAGTATITVTTKAKNKKNKKVTKKMVVTVNAPAPAPTTQSTTMATTTQAPNNNNNNTNETPTPAPTAKKVTKISSINDQTGEIVLTFESTVTVDELKGTTLTVTAKDGTSIKAEFVEVSAEGNTATYKVDVDKITTGEYTVTSDVDSVEIPKKIGSTSANVQITGSAVKGLVYYKDNGVYGIKNAKVTVGGKTVKTDEDGFYEVKATPKKNAQVSVKAEGFFDAVKNNVDVADNEASAYNFKMEPYDISKVYIYGTVTNASDAKQVVEDAVVTLYEDGEIKAQVKTDSKGRYVFKNDEADVANFPIDSALAYEEFTYSDYISKDKEYTIKVEKDLSSENLKDVYGAYTTSVIDLGSMENVIVNVRLTKIKAMGDITFNLKWNEDAVNKADSKELEVSFMDQDGVTTLKKAVIDLTSYLKDNNTEMRKSYKLVADKYFGENANIHPTLPSGTYYLVVKDLATDSEQQNATAVIPVKLSEGGSQDVSATIEKAISRTISYSVSLSDNHKKKSFANQSEAGDLKTVVDNNGTLGETIVVKTNVYEKVSGKNVLIDSLSDTKLSTQGKGNQDYPAYTANTEKNNLAKNKKYVVETIKSNLTSKTVEGDTASEVGWTVNLSGAVNVVKVKVADKDCFKDQYAVNGTAEDEVVMVKAITVQSGDNKATVDVNKKYSLSDLYNDGIDVVTDCDDYSAFCGLKPGEYTVALDIDGYKLSSDKNEQDEKDTVIDLEDAEIVSEAKYEKVYPTTVTGVLAYKTVAGNVNVLGANGVAVLYNEDMTQIVAASRWTTQDGQVTYTLEDGIDGTFGAGNYVLVIRGKGIDTQQKKIEIKAPNTVVKNQNFVELAVGGNSNIISTVKASNNSPLSGNASVVAYDEYYINPTDESVDILAARVLMMSSYNGCYPLSFNVQTDSTWSVDNISAGKYNVEINSDITVSEVKAISVEGTYTQGMTVQLKNLDDLIRINLILSNYDSNFEIGQVDYIVAVSKDGTVKNEGIFVRNSKEKDAGYFYVPRDKEYMIYIYSNGTLVTKEEKTAQAKENETIRVSCEPIQ